MVGDCGLERLFCMPCRDVCMCCLSHRVVHDALHERTLNHEVEPVQWSLSTVETEVKLCLVYCSWRRQRRRRVTRRRGARAFNSASGPRRSPAQLPLASASRAPSPVPSTSPPPCSTPTAGAHACLATFAALVNVSSCQALSWHPRTIKNQYRC